MSTIAMYDSHDLETLIRAGTPLLFCSSNDESRILSIVTDTAQALNKHAWRWTCLEGLCRIEQNSKPQHFLSEPEAMLSHLRKLTHPGIFAILDFHPYLDQPRNIRLLKEIALEGRTLGHTLLFISHELQIPAELRGFAASYTFPVPSIKEIATLVHQELQAFLKTSEVKTVEADAESVQKLIHALRGLPEIDIRRLARAAMYDDAAITKEDVAQVMHTKRAFIESDGVLEFSFNTTEFTQVAGLQNLKKWLNLRRGALIETSPHTPQLQAPKGILLLGMQGCGKSLAAKAVAGSWHIPLLRLDMGAVFNKYMGETERRLRDALKNAEVIAPCVLWIDEIEKGLSSTDFDGGTAQRSLGTLLTWMAERKAPVFLVATANAIDALPPELLRKGRFDEIFFVDLPSPEVRAELFKIHLTQRNIPLRNFDLSTLVDHTEGFSGAEIEQLIVSALYAVQTKELRLDTAQLCAEAANTRPLSRLRAEEVQQLRHWAQQRCVMAD